MVDPVSSSSLGNDELVTATIANQGLNDMSDFDIELVIDGESVETMAITETIAPFGQSDFQFTVPQDFSAVGDYNVRVIVTDPDDGYGNNDTLDVVLSKVHELDGEIEIGDIAVTCNNTVEVNGIIANKGENTITLVQIEVVVNDLVVDVVEASVNAPFQEQDAVLITITENLEDLENSISLNLLEVNGESDDDASNNSATATTTMDSGYDTITLIINADNYPSETSWEVIDAGTNQIIASGGVNGAGQAFTEDICVNYGSCFILMVYDSWGDGICCGYGMGNFLVQNAAGETIVSNDGNFDYEAMEQFCPNGAGCVIDADLYVINASSDTANDGVISIFAGSGVSPFQYSIDGGQSFGEGNTFTDLAPGEYNVVVIGSAGLCSFEQTVIIEACSFTSVEITVTNASSVTSTDGMIEINPTSGVPPYQYSIDGGQTFVSSNIFTGLPVGPYNVVVLDAMEVCEFEGDAPIYAEDDIGVEELNAGFAEGIKLYPNPTDNSFSIEFASFLSETVNIEVYDQMGRMIKVATLLKDGGRIARVSLDGYGSGAYLIRCYNSTQRKSFKVVKI